MSVLPQLTLYEAAAQDVPVEYAYDFAKNELKTLGGRYYTVSGLEALKIWAYKKLLTPRAAYPAYSTAYGHTLTEVFGLADREIVQAEIKKRLEEALDSPYIKALKDFSFAFEGGHVTVRFTIESVFGEIEEEQTY